MAYHNGSRSAAIHSRLGHPVIDADGHWVEHGPTIAEYVKEVIGADAAERYQRLTRPVRAGSPLGFEERRARRIPQNGWWVLPSKNTLDRATSMLPKLLYERLDELGLDFIVLYPTFVGSMVSFVRDDELRRGGSRAFNIFAMDMFGEFADRMTPAAAVPMHTPQEAIEELEHVKKLGYKVVMLSGLTRRTTPAKTPDGRGVNWRDTFALDSDYDYDPVWAKCVELGLVPTFHNSTQDSGFRNSTSNWVYNHIGHFAVGGEAMCKALFLGGVTRRFPKLKFAFLEGGVAWACSLYNDLIAHWKTRNAKALENLDPANLDRESLMDLFQRYGNRHMRESAQHFGLQEPEYALPPHLDEFWRCAIERAEDIPGLFVPNFYFGCEAEDALNAWAFNTRINPFGARLGAILGSDIGHFDVTDMSDVLAEAYELVEKEVLNDADFRDLTFANAARFFGGMNPDFFKGTVVERQVAQLLSGA